MKRTRGNYMSRNLKTTGVAILLCGLSAPVFAAHANPWANPDDNVMAKMHDTNQARSVGTPGQDEMNGQMTRSAFGKLGGTPNGGTASSNAGMNTAGASGQGGQAGGAGNGGGAGAGSGGGAGNGGGSGSGGGAGNGGGAGHGGGHGNGGGQGNGGGHGAGHGRN